MIYFLITTSLIQHDYEIRKQQYINGINKIKEATKDLTYKLLIIENNGKRETFLDDLGIEVLYTNNNKIRTGNKGVKELKDVWDSIIHLNIQDDDLIVKITGRYILQENSEFMEALEKDTDCIMKYGNCQYTVTHKVPECLTVLVAMKSKYVKKIKIPSENECVEWCWAKGSFEIPENRITVHEKIELMMRGSKNQFKIPSEEINEIYYYCNPHSMSLSCAFLKA